MALGNGGATLFWDMATFSLVERRSSHAVFGSSAEVRGRRCAPTPQGGPHNAPVVPAPSPGRAGADNLRVAHNETSTGARTDVIRIEGPILAPSWW